MVNRIITGIGAAIALLIGIACFSAWFLSGGGSSYYYVQIDNSKIEEGHPRDGVVDLSGGMEYSYTLHAYDEGGKGTDITFGASRELREGAYLQLKVKPVRGVVEWEEVQYDELPAAVQSRLQR